MEPGMKIIDFGLGIRFAAGFDDICLRELTETLCAADVAGMELYAGEVQDLRYSTENTFICVFTKSKIKPIQHVFRTLSEDAAITSLLCGSMPFIQTHALEGMSGLKYLGEIREDGTLSETNDIAFTKTHRTRKKAYEAQYGLLFIADCADGTSAQDGVKAFRSLARKKFENARMDVVYISPKRGKMTDSFFELGGAATARILKAGADGERQLRLGVLNGQTAFIEAPETSMDLDILIARAKNEGLKQIWIDSRFDMPDDWKKDDPQIIWLDDETALAKAQCAYGRITERLARASFVWITGPDEANRFWLELCEEHHIEALRFANSEELYTAMQNK